MPQATHTPTTGRSVTLTPSRRQFGGASLAALCGAAFAGAVVLPDPGEAFPPPANPDADLLATCARFDALERAYQRTDFTCVGGTPEDLASDAERSRIAAAQVPLVERMGEMQAFTRAGQVARARSLALWKPELLNDAPGDFAEVLMAAIVRDLVGEA